MSPRPKLDHLLKRQIVDAAELLYERSLFDTRIGDIARQASTSSPAALYYFESKDMLFEEAVDQTDRHSTAGSASDRPSSFGPATSSCI